MSESTESNIYAAPTAKVETASNSDAQTEFHLTGVVKVALFNFLSFGIYSLVWFFQQWRRQKLYGGEECWPIARAIFQIFFVYALLLHIKNKAEDNKLTVRWGAGITATIFIVASIFANVYDKFIDESTFSPLLSLIAFFSILIIPTLILAMAQNTINRIYKDVVEDLNASFSAVNWVFLLLLLVFWGLMVFGLTQI